MSDIIKPTVGRKVWYRPQGASFLKPDGMVVTTPSVYGDQPLDATVIYVWNDRMVNLDVTDHAGNRFIATSAILVQEGDHKPSGAYAEWMPYQKGQSSKAAAAAGNDHATQVLYPAIKAAMDELEKLHPGVNLSVNKAFNILRKAYWSETPAPASASQERAERLCTCGPNEGCEGGTPCIRPNAIAGFAHSTGLIGPAYAANKQPNAGLSD